MWAYYVTYFVRVVGDPEWRDLDYISIIPTPPEGANINEYYDRIFAESAADHHFVENEDPHFDEKIKRNRKRSRSPWYVIDENDGQLDGNTFTFGMFETERTSLRVRRLSDKQGFLRREDRDDL